MGTRYYWRLWAMISNEKKDFSLLWVCESRVLEYWIDTCTQNIVFSLVGIGLATLLIDVLLSTYYIVILAWGLYYLYVSLRGVLLWETCGNAWNTDRSVGFISRFKCCCQPFFVVGVSSFKILPVRRNFLIPFELCLITFEIIAG